MADKKEKPYRLPAIGKPKKAPPKSSIRQMGERAGKNYMKDDKSNPDVTNKKLVEVDAAINNFRSRPATASGRKGRELAAEAQSRRTGMAKGGLVTKKKKK